MAVKTLRNSKTYNTPAIFLNPHTKQDGEAIRELNDSYPIKETSDGIRSIDGFLIDVKDWKEVSTGMRLEQSSLNEKRSLRSRVFIVESGIEFLLRGSALDKGRMAKTQLFDPKLVSKVNEISEKESLASAQKTDKFIREAYPLIDARTIRDNVEFALQKETDMLVRPTVPITSIRNLSRQAEKYKSMIRDFKALLSTTFNSIEGKIDEMNILTVQASVIEPENFGALSELALADSPNHVGIRLMNVDSRNESRLGYILQFLRELRQTMIVNDMRRPIHVINVDAFGFTTLCNGAQTFTTPIGSDPYYYSRGHDPENPPDHHGSFYHLQKRTHVLWKKLRIDCMDTEPPYRLPCYCEVCELYETITKVESLINWGYFRRLHETLARDIEVAEMRRVPESLFAQSIKDMLGRSSTPYASLMTDDPIIDF